MTASALPPFRVSPTNRDVIIDRIRNLPDGWVVRCGPPKRSLDQNAALHGYCAQIAKARPVWNGMDMTADDYKALFITSHAIATSGGTVRLVPDLEGHGLVQLRESSAAMTRDRASSLLSYIDAWAAAQGIELVRHDGGGSA